MLMKLKVLSQGMPFYVLLFEHEPSRKITSLLDYTRYLQIKFHYLAFLISHINSLNLKK